MARINRELGADFKLDRFEHVAKFNSEARSVEMHLRSKQAQVVNIPDAEITVPFAEGETIWTESSHKYCLEELFQIADEAKFQCSAQWVDHGCTFAVDLIVAV